VSTQIDPPRGLRDQPVWAAVALTAADVLNHPALAAGVWAVLAVRAVPWLLDRLRQGIFGGVPGPCPRFPRCRLDISRPSFLGPCGKPRCGGRRRAANAPGRRRRITRSMPGDRRRTRGDDAFPGASPGFPLLGPGFGRLPPGSRDSSGSSLVAVPAESAGNRHRPAGVIAFPVVVAQRDIARVRSRAVGAGMQRNQPGARWNSRAGRISGTATTGCQFPDSAVTLT
jgi:hypothetical protein